jgi:MltA-interacting protein MipA
MFYFYLFACFSVSPSFAQSQGMPTGQQTQQAPPPTTNLTPSGIRVDVGGAHNGSIYTSKFPDFTITLPQEWRAQDVASRQRSAEAGAETPAQSPDKQAEASAKTPAQSPDKQAEAGAKTPAQSPDEQSASQESVARHTFTYGAEANFSSGLAWRGLSLHDGPVGQPSAWVSAFGFTFSACSDVALTRTSESAGLKSSDLTLTYDRDWKKLKIGAALDAYFGRQSSDIESRNTMEGSLGLSYPAGPLRIFTTHAFDVLAYRGSYFGEAGLEYERQVTKSAEFAISIRSGWASSKFNDVYIGVDKSAFNFAGAEGSLTYSLGPRLYFQPRIEFSSITARKLSEQLEQANTFNYGLAVGFRK